MHSAMSKCKSFFSKNRSSSPPPPPSSLLATENLVTVSTNSLNNLNADNPRLSLKFDRELNGKAMGGSSTNGQLMYCSSHRLFITDMDGTEVGCIVRTHKGGPFTPKEICWSSFLNQFLVLPYRHHLLFITELPDTNTMKTVLQFKMEMASLTCYEDRMLVCSYGKGSIIEQYDLTDWSLVKSYEPPISCSNNHLIRQIRFNQNGTCLGIINCEGDFSDKYWFELRDAEQLKVLHIVDIIGQKICAPLLLPRSQQFLLHLSADKPKLLLINSNNGQLEETIPYNADYINSTALINEKCLVIDTGGELRFYDLE